MPFRIEYGDILESHADAIVVSADPRPQSGNGLNKKIYSVAGRNRLLNARKKFGHMSIGHAEITEAFNLREQYKYIIHVVAPKWKGGTSNEEKLLRTCYKNALDKAYQNGCKSIVFPLLSTGVLNYPIDEALEVAKQECESFCGEHPDIFIRLVRLKEDDIENKYKEAEKAYGNFPAYTKEREYLEELQQACIAKENADNKYKEVMKLFYQRNNKENTKIFTSFREEDLDERIKNVNDDFNFSMIFEMFRLKKSVGTQANICQKINLNEATLSHYLNEDDRRVKRKHIWILAVALHLNIDETELLFNACGFSIYGNHWLDPAEKKWEKAVRYFIECEEYNVGFIDDQLMKRNLDSLSLREE